MSSRGLIRFGVLLVLRLVLCWQECLWLLSFFDNSHFLVSFRLLGIISLGVPVSFFATNCSKSVELTSSRKRPYVPLCYKITLNSLFINQGH